MKRTSNYLERATLVDILHLAAIITCTAWTAKLILEERLQGDLSPMAVLHGHSEKPEGSITIRLDETAQTAAR